MGLLGTLGQIGSLFIPGAGGKVVGALAGMADGMGADDGAAYYAEAAAKRRRAAELLAKAQESWDKTVQTLDFSPDAELAQLDKSTAFYNDLNQKNSVANAALSKVMRSTQPGAALSASNAEMRLRYGDMVNQIVNNAKQRRLAVEQQSNDNAARMAGLEQSQTGMLLDQGNRERSAADANTMGGLQGLVKLFGDADVSNWVQGRLGVKTPAAQVAKPVLPKLQTKLATNYSAPAGVAMKRLATVGARL
jgi:hypothetical protein